VSAFTLFVFACRRSACARRSPFTAALALALAGVAATNVITFYFLLATNRITAGFPVPLSSLICIGMLLVAREAWSRHPERQRVIA
jgi:hypothetical protein